VLRSWDDFDRALREIALIDLQVGKLDATRQEEILAATTTFDVLSQKPLKNRERLADELKAYYKAHRKEAEAGGKKSIDLNFGRAGFRKGGAKLALRKGWKWGDVLKAIKERFDGRFVKTKESVDKDALKKAATNAIPRLADGDLEAVGVQIKQAEEFFFETYPEKAEQAA
jgi:phage host-nuclease inhibitor protein Gam